MPLDFRLQSCCAWALSILARVLARISPEAHQLVVTESNCKRTDPYACC